MLIASRSPWCPAERTGARIAWGAPFGAGGHCPTCFRPRRCDVLRVVAVDVQVETIINRRPGEVAAYAGDATNAPEWYVNIKSVDWRTPPPVVVGSQIDFVAQFLGRR